MILKLLAVDCAAGFGVDDMMGCVACPENTYNNDTTENCIECNEGFSTNGRTQQTNITDCNYRKWYLVISRCYLLLPMSTLACLIHRYLCTWRAEQW